MARQYSYRQFFRRTANALLARYFKERHNVLLDIDFEKLAEADMEPLFEAIKSLPPDIPAGIEAECLEIYAMACQGGCTALVDEADFHGDTISSPGTVRVPVNLLEATS